MVAAAGLTAVGVAAAVATTGETSGADVEGVGVVDVVLEDDGEGSESAGDEAEDGRPTGFGCFPRITGRFTHKSFGINLTAPKTCG